MTGFFVAIILTGSFITTAALVMLVMDKSRERDYRLDVTERRDKLVDVMDDADQLVEELNRFADYAVSTCEEKRLEVERVLHRADQLIGQVAAASASLEAVLASQSGREMADKPSAGTSQPERERPVPGEAAVDTEKRAQPIAPRGRVLTLDARRAEALRLARTGVTHAEIARTLRLGKGEIELIARMGGTK